MIQQIQVLDCTLRDGGYMNDWRFGIDNSTRIIESLADAGIDIVECGYLTQNGFYNKEYTKCSKIEDFEKFISGEKRKTLFVCMINYGEVDIESIPTCNKTYIEGIRVAFHKEEMEEAIEFCREVKKKGYKVFVQPMVSLSYQDVEILNLLEKVNQIDPYAFYLVDSFGVMKESDLIRLYYLVEHNLKKEIIIGYHSHNNMQLAFSNAQALLKIQTNRRLLFDTTVFGMGRGAGNLNTELFIEYLNNVIGSNYNIKLVVRLMDTVISKFYIKNPWGYSLPYYLSAMHQCHPSYAAYLNDKNALMVEDIENILAMMEENKKNSYDKGYIERLYYEFMEKGKIVTKNINDIVNRLKQNKVLIIAPGKSAEEVGKICSIANRNNVVTISINFAYPYAETDYIFVSNIKRFQELDSKYYNKTIVTSNIKNEFVFAKTDYKELLNNIEGVKDNAGMMILKFLEIHGIKEVYIAGLDGYSNDFELNYVNKSLELMTRKDVLNQMNLGLQKAIKEFSNKIKLNFVTVPRYIQI